MTLPDSAILNNLYIDGTARMDDPFERIYIRARTREKRNYDDKEVANLPEILPSHPHYGEWTIRKASAERLVNYLRAKSKPLCILEVGCGNGWLSHRLLQIPGSQVTGQDINFTELQQAARVFNDRAHLRFVYGDLFQQVLREKMFDVIVFAASIQYFPSFHQVIAFGLDHLCASGEIHILDSHFYAADEVTAARKRTEDHFRLLGVPEMNAYYFHHTRNSLNNFHHQLLFDPASLRSRLLGKHSPFPWVRIKKK